LRETDLKSNISHLGLGIISLHPCSYWNPWIYFTKAVPSN